MPAFTLPFSDECEWSDTVEPFCDGYDHAVLTVSIGTGGKGKIEVTLSGPGKTSVTYSKDGIDNLCLSAHVLTAESAPPQGLPETITVSGRPPTRQQVDEGCGCLPEEPECEPSDCPPDEYCPQPEG